MVFGLRGLHSNWMIPIAYGFTADTMPAPQIVNAVKDVMLMCKEAGIKLVATCCDQGATNVSAINLLRYETERIIKKMDDAELKESGFERGFNFNLKDFKDFQAK